MSIKKILLGKGTILLALLLAYNNTLLAQDTEFWFVAPDVDEIYATGKCDDPARVILTAGDKPAVVLIKYKGGDKQIPLTLTAGETKLVTFARTPAAGQYALADIENRPANSTTTKNKFGIQVTSDNPIYASYMADGPCLKDLFTLKGSGALGKEFFLSFQNKYPFTTTSYPNSRRSFHIVATEDNTNIAINLKNSTLEGCGANTTLNISLNAGETWAGVGSNATQPLFGTKITSDKNIAVAVYESTFNGDMIGDQIVPVDQLAKSYIVLRTYPINRQVDATEYAFIMATKPNTTFNMVDASGSSTLETLINAGDMYELPVTSEYYMVEASEPLYVYHLSAMLKNPVQESGASLLPSMYSIQSRDMAFYKSNSSAANALNHYIFVITHKDNIDGFSVNGSSTVIVPSSFSPFHANTGLSDWRYTRLHINAWPAGVNTVKNTKGAFSLGYMFGDNTCGSYGYLSGFGDFSFPEISYKCEGQSLTLYAGYAKSYRWWKGPAADVNNNPTIIGTSNSYTVPANEEGYYSVEIDTDPKKIVVETYVQNDALDLVIGIPQFVKVNNEASFSATVTRPEGKTFDWAFADATPASGSGATVSGVKWSDTGGKTVTLTVKNPELGCPDEAVSKTVYVYDIQDDYAGTTKNKAVEAGVLANDDFPTLTATVSSIAINPQNGNAVVSNNKIIYTPSNGFIGYDSLRYEVTYGAHTANAWLRLSVAEEPDNISDAECFDDPLGIDFTLKPLSSTSTAYSVNSYNIPIVGDIDNDGYTEIIVGRTSTSGVSTNQLYIFKLKDNKLEHQQTLATPYFNNVADPYSIAKVDNNDYAAIFICTDHIKNTAANQLKLIKYVYNPNTMLYEEFKVSGVEKRGAYSALSTKEMAQPMIVDFNGDGIPEVVTYDKVFNARTMELLVDGDYLKNADKTDDTATGFGFGGHMNNNQTSQGASIMAIGDMDGDGVPEVIGGNCAYKVNITNPTGASGNSFTLWSKCGKQGPNNETHNEAVDGATAIADMDGDGLLDVIVTNGRFRNPSGKGGLYIWNPRTGKVMHTDIINDLPIYSDNQWAYGVSVAFIGDIDNADGKNQPEICFTGYMKSYAFRYDPQTKRLTQKWVINTNDDSGATTMVMFDFDQDGDNELVYRDTQSLRILDGKTGANKIPVTACTSGTAIEYPVVADINGDGAAEIIVTGDTRLHVYASSPAGTWAPARKVWNQFAYNSVNINEDLTVPKVRFNPATTLTGGGCGDVRPYNGYLLQQTTLNKFGCPLFLLPNLNFDGNPSYSHHAKGDSLIINVKLKNEGDAAIGPPVYVSVYKDDILPANFMAAAGKNIAVLPGQTGECTIKVENISSFAPYEKLVVRLNDDGSGTPVQQECDYDNNDGFKPRNQMLIAVNDTLAIPTNSLGKSADVLTNDRLAECTVANINIDFVVGKPPARGSASIASGKEIDFVPTPSYVGTDSLQYEIICGDDKATAELYIVIQALLKIERVDDASEPNKKGKCKVGFVEAGASYHRPIVVTYEISGGSAIHSTDYTDVITGTVTIPQYTNGKEFEIATPYNNYKVEGNDRTVEIKITSVETL